MTQNTKYRKKGTTEVRVYLDGEAHEIVESYIFLKRLNNQNDAIVMLIKEHYKSNSRLKETVSNRDQ